MQQVLEEIVGVYQGTRTSNLPTLANKIEAAGEKWQASAEWTDKYVSKLSKWGAVEMHHQLALSSVPSRVNFDAAQLAFCLRIHCLGEASQDTEIAEKALEILLETQRTNGTWPVGAALATDFETGASIFSTNLEVIGAIAPLIKDHGGIQRHATILSRVYDWLIANRRSIEFNGTTIRGWSADYIWERGRVDVWATGLVLDFLVQYRDLIVDGMARRLRNCKYDVRLPSELKVTLRTLIDPQAEESFDQQITRRIMADYINTFRTTGKSKNSSMVLYGPPGTSKTTFAEAIAKELEWSLVTITPSDFVQNGIERSEDMARKLFADLLDLRDVVVLFDECDEMFRDRSDTGLKDIGMLRFIVPGMLPKLQLLKKHGEEHGLIFIVATNYNERLDRAIVRPGRIDERFLVPPYDQKARACLIDGFLKGIRGLSEDVATRVEIADALAVWTAGWVFPEIKTLSDRLREKYKDFEAELKASPQDIGASLREKLIVTGPTQELGYTFGFAPNLVRALNPGRIYDKDRKGADKERDVVVKICSTPPVPQRKTTISPPKTNAATKKPPAARKNAVKRAVNNRAPLRSKNGK
jgi:adenylate kinase family enzyme